MTSLYVRQELLSGHYYRVSIFFFLEGSLQAYFLTTGPQYLIYRGPIFLHNSISSECMEHGMEHYIEHYMEHGIEHSWSMEHGALHEALSLCSFFMNNLNASHASHAFHN